MKLYVKLKNCCRSQDERVRLEDIFKQAMLGFIPSVEKLKLEKDALSHDWYAAIKRGYWALDGLSGPEIAKLQVEIEIK